MHLRTLATLDKLESAAWFSRVGMKDVDIAIVLFVLGGGRHTLQLA
jgi:hypothetical protein